MSENWREWLVDCSEDPSSPAKIPPGSLGAITGQDARALGAIDACWNLLAYCDETGVRAVLAAVRALLPAVQPQCRFFARELIARNLDWSDRARYWPKVQP